MSVLSIQAQLAEAVAAALNTQTFALDIEAKRGWRPITDIEEAEKLLVTVVPLNLKRATLLSRGGSRLHELGVEIVVQKQHGGADLTPEALAERCDPIAHLVQEIEDFLADPDNRLTVELTTAPAQTAQANPTDVETEFDPDCLLEDGIFKMRVAVAYRLQR